MKTFTSSDYYDILDDINRIESMCVVLVANIESILGTTVTITTKTNWTRTDIPTVEQMERIRGNVETIAKVLDTSYSIPQFDNRFNFNNANDLEIAVDYVYQYLRGLIKVISQPIANLYYANEPILLASERS